MKALGMTSEIQVEVLGMTPEMQKIHDTLRNPEDIFKQAESEGRELTSEEASSVLTYEANLLRLKVLPPEQVVRQNSEQADDRIDSRFEWGNHIPLVCNECGAVFSTKNITRIGARSIFGYQGGKESRYEYMHLSTLCDHSSSSLRLTTDAELEYLKSLKH